MTHNFTAQLSIETDNKSEKKEKKKKKRVTHYFKVQLKLIKTDKIRQRTACSSSFHSKDPRNITVSSQSVLATARILWPSEQTGKMTETEDHCILAERKATQAHPCIFTLNNEDSTRQSQTTQRPADDCVSFKKRKTKFRLP